MLHSNFAKIVSINTFKVKTDLLQELELPGQTQISHPSSVKWKERTKYDAETACCNVFVSSRGIAAPQRALEAQV